MAINDDWTYTRTLAGLGFTVFAVNLDTGEAVARAAFMSRIESEQFARDEAEITGAGPGWGFAVERNDDGFVTWTSF